MTNNFNNNVMLEVQTAGISNLLVTSTNTVYEPELFPTVTNPEFATNTTGWTAGTGWTLARQVGPPTKGRITKSASVVAGELLLTNTQNIAAAAGELWSTEISITRVSTSPASANMQLRLNLVAYNVSNVRLGVVVGYNGTVQTVPDAVLAPADVGIDYSFTPYYTAVTPAGTTYLRLEIVAGNAWTYAATAFSIDVHGYVPYRSYDRTSTGWTGTNITMRETYSGWDAARTAESNPVIESDKTAVVPGMPIAVSADVCDVDALSAVTVTAYNTVIGIRYYDASNVFLSESVASAVPGAEVYSVTDQLANTFQQATFKRIGYSHVVPAGATKATVVFKLQTGVFYGGFFWDKVVMIQGTADEIADTSYGASLPANSSNRIMNPSGELGVQGWSDFDGNSVLTTRNNLPANYKAYDFRFGGTWDAEEPAHKEIVLAQVTGGYQALYSNTTAVTAGQWVGGSVLANGRGYFPPSGSYIISYVSVGWQFRDSADAVISTSLSSPVLVQNGYYRYIKAPVMQAPAGTVRARMVVQNSGDNVSWTPSNPNAWMMIKRAQMNVGATQASVTNQLFAFVEHFKNILGGTHEIGIDRNELDTGVLTATILDPTLDPAEFNTLVPGLKVRLRTLVDAVWETTFYGSITNAKTTYDVDTSTGALKPIITIEAADPTTQLVQNYSPNTVATINGLANNMPSDLRWNINGQTAIGVNPTVVAVNPQATFMDQVMITRDTVGGYAWMDRTGVFNAWDAFNLQKTSAWMSDQQRPATTGRNENIVPNPTFQLGISLWSGAGGTLAWDSPTKSGKLTATGGVAAYAYLADVAIHEGDTVAAKVDATVVAGKGWQGHLIFYNSAHAELSRINTDATGWVTGTVPTSAVSMRVAIDLYNAPTGTTVPVAGTVLTVNSAMVVINPDSWTGAYFDGDSAYAYWTGAVHASTSVRDYALYQDYLTNIDIGYNTQEVINQVTLKVPTRNAEGTYDDVVYGPYQDTTSVATWGPQKVEMTIAGGVTPSTVATRILASNANPARTVNSITFIVDDVDSFKKAATIDLYDLVYIGLAGKVAKKHRVSGIQHSLTAGIKDGLSEHRWEVTLFFKAVDTAAQVSGSAPTGSSATDPGPVFAKAHMNAATTSFANNSYLTITGWTVDEIGGCTFSSGTGLFTVTKSGMYLVNTTILFAANTVGVRGARINVNGTLSRLDLRGASGSGNCSAQITDIVRLTAGQSVGFIGFQNSGAALNILGDAGGTLTGCSLRWLGE